MPRFLQCVLLLMLTGCYAPLRSPGVDAQLLPESFRYPVKANSVGLHYAMLTGQTPPEYLLGQNDLIRIEVSDLVPKVGRLPPVQDPMGGPREQGPFSYVFDATVSQRGEVLLPLVGTVMVGDLTLEQARQRIIENYSKGFLDNPRVAVSLVQKSMVRIMVLGSVARPEVYDLPKYENDVAHAITKAGGLIDDKADEIQVHRRVLVDPYQGVQTPLYLDAPAQPPRYELKVMRFPLRSPCPVAYSPEDATLYDGDVVVVRDLPDEVFFVVGKLNSNNLLRFSVSRDQRDLGNGFLLPKDRDIDVITAVAMAGYIDPIESPTTVTVHRAHPDGTPLLIHVDLISARYDRRENILVQAGDIIYLNPDGAWWFRRTLDRVIPNLITIPYGEAMSRWINPQRFR